MSETPQRPGSEGSANRGDDAGIKAREAREILEPTLWFAWENISDRALAVVSRRAPEIMAALRKEAWWATTNCNLASSAWYDAFASAGVPVEAWGGDYWPDWEHDESDGLEPPSMSEHVWLRVDGAIFDPTAGQFDGVIDFGAYRGRPISRRDLAG